MQRYDYREGRPSLVRARPPRDDMRPITILSLEDTPSGSGRLRGSASNVNTGDDTGRSSRASRTSRESRGTRQSLHASQMSLDTQRTQASMQEMVMVEEA